MRFACPSHYNHITSPFNTIVHATRTRLSDNFTTPILPGKSLYALDTYFFYFIITLTVAWCWTVLYPLLLAAVIWFVFIRCWFEINNSFPIRVRFGGYELLKSNVKIVQPICEMPLVENVVWSLYGEFKSFKVCDRRFILVDYLRFPWLLGYIFNKAYIYR